MRRVQGSGMTGRAAGTSELRRSPRAGTRATAAAVAAVVLVAACGSGTEEPADSSPVPGTAEPAAPEDAPGDAPGDAPREGQAE